MCILAYVRMCIFACRPSDEIFQALDDNQVTLATMKASRYVKPFIGEVDKWERTLSQILEVIEMIVQVQRQWMYLEVRSVCSIMNSDACTPLRRRHGLCGDQLWEYHCWPPRPPHCPYGT